MNEFLQTVIDRLQHFSQGFKIPLEDPILIFSLILTIILLSPLLLRRFKLPGIIGLIISGVIIGPYGLNILEKSSAVELFSTIGLLYIMFIAGLELDLSEFKKHKYKSLLFAIYTFVIPFALGFPACFYLLEYNMDASILTASMFATHTLVAYPIVSKFGISKDKAVAVTVGGTILTDTAVLIVLAVIMGKHEGELNQNFWIQFGVSFTIFLIIMFALIPRIAKWFFRIVESEKYLHYIFVLSVVFFSSFLAHLAGVEPIIGAFMAGLALNPLIPHSSALMNRIDFIGNSIFIPFFLISVGMLVDVSVLFNGPNALFIAAVLTTVALLGKYLAAFFTQVSFRFSKAQRKLIFGLSGAHAAATLAVILVGYKAGIIDDNILNGTIILILIACIVASFATEKAARIIALKENDDIDEGDNDFKNNEHILIPAGDLQNIEKIISFSILIKDKKSFNPITMLSVVPNDHEAESNIMLAKRKIDSLAKDAIASETKVNFINTIDHNPASGIVRASREIMASIIVMDWTHKHKFVEKIIGDKTDSIIENTNKMLILVSFQKPLIIQKRIFVTVPPSAEVEQGFALWVAKVAAIARELSIPIIFYCNEKTTKYIKKIAKKLNSSVKMQFELFVDWDDYLVLSKNITSDDLLVLIAARKNSISHINALDNIPHKLEKYFKDNNRILVYPQQFSVSFDNYKDVSAEPLSKGIDSIKKIGKGMGTMFKK